jgi:catechol 2,3-dioxygenase-like lactoylglutathione lyase family enzyme
LSAVAHVGVSVTDLDRAVRWYGDVLGLDPIGAPVEVQAGEGHGGAVAADVFGRGFGRFRQAHLASSNGVALELFEFEPPPADWRAGIFHVCFAVGHVASVAARAGRQRTRVLELFPGEPYRTCYCEDPFGNAIELYSHSHERTWANRS